MDGGTGQGRTAADSQYSCTDLIASAVAELISGPVVWGNMGQRTGGGGGLKSG